MTVIRMEELITETARMTETVTEIMTEDLATEIETMIETEVMTVTEIRDSADVLMTETETAEMILPCLRP